MRLLVAVDSGTLHLGAAAGRPVVGLFGPGSPALWAPVGARHRALQATEGCHGCRLPACPFPAPRCQEGLAVERVAAAAKAGLAGLAAAPTRRTSG
jgi:ADP-heptose:LPS heptosyltransferase